MKKNIFFFSGILMFFLSGFSLFAAKKPDAQSVFLQQMTSANAIELLTQLASEVHVIITHSANCRLPDSLTQLAY